VDAEEGRDFRGTPRALLEALPGPVEAGENRATPRLVEDSAAHGEDVHAGVQLVDAVRRDIAPQVRPFRPAPGAARDHEVDKF
jgi:hypothetical protein